MFDIAVLREAENEAELFKHRVKRPAKSEKTTSLEKTTSPEKAPTPEIPKAPTGFY